MLVGHPDQYEGRLGPCGRGITLATLATQVPVGSGELQQLVGQLTQADWLTDAPSPTPTSPGD
ncbi:hypothetical protein AB0N50_34105 [Streptomyces pharetrae]|jgi:hypothetical protein|uniref:hypothetical protein n=1 Tax=Streptomyces pharetrae TaxID=291370 RepID=UPI0034600269